MPESAISPETDNNLLFIEPDIICDLDTIALDRCNVKRNGGVSNKRIDQKRTDFEIDYLGVQAEYYFSLLFNVDMHHIPGALAGDKGKFDYEIEGLTFGIKGVFSNAQYLLVPKHQYPVTADILVMFKQISKRSIKCFGYTSGEYFMGNHEWKNLGYGHDAVMHHTNLLPIKELIEIINQHDAVVEEAVVEEAVVEE